MKFYRKIIEIMKFYREIIENHEILSKNYEKS